MWGGKYGTVNDIRGECSAASMASSHQQSTFERSIGEMIACPCSEDLEEDSFLKKRQQQPQEAQQFTRLIAYDYISRIL